MEWTTIVTALVAVYGAGLSTYTFYLNKAQTQRRLTITFSQGFRTFGSRTSNIMLFFTIANPGFKPVVINDPHLKLPDGSSIYFFPPMSDVTFPYELGEGRSCKVMADMKELADELREKGYEGKIELIAEVQDGAGKMYKSKKPWVINLNEWLK